MGSHEGDVSLSAVVALLRRHAKGLGYMVWCEVERG